MIIIGKFCQHSNLPTFLLSFCVQGSDTVSGMFKWRADRKQGCQQSKDENSESR